MTNFKLTILFTILTLVWCGLIFWFSHQPSDESVKYSSHIGDWVCEHLVDGYKDMPEPQKSSKHEDVIYAVRKMAHVIEYIILGALVTATLVLWMKERFGLLFVMFMSCLFGAFYATTDEFHQSFVSGRSGELRDVAIDSVGAFIGVLSVAFIILAVRWFGGKKH